MSTVAELTQQRDAALAKADAVIGAAERGRRAFTAAEQQIADSSTREVERLNTQIAAMSKESRSHSVEEMKALVNSARGKAGVFSPPVTGRRPSEPMAPRRFSEGYYNAFYRLLTTGEKSGGLLEGTGLSGEQIIPLKKSAALYESGGGPSGGYATPEMTAEYIAPLAPTASDIRSIATVIPTDRDILVPTTAPTGMPAPALTTELSEFGGTAPSLAQTELNAYMIAQMVPVSFQLAQDVTGLEAWLRNQVEAGFLEYEDTYFTEGSGSGEPQGLIGNVGAGITAEPDGSGNAVSIDGCSTLLGQLKPKYLSNASWLMNQATAVTLRKSQVESNLFYIGWRRENGRDFLHGFPVYYSASMPSAQRGNAPILVGDFRRGMIIGDRGGSALRLKVLDQLLATTGTLWWLLFRRTDARVWVQEAIQQYNIALS